VPLAAGGPILAGDFDGDGRVDLIVEDSRAVATAYRFSAGAWVVVPTDFRAHGKDERIPVQSLYDNVVHWEMMLRELTGK